MISFVNLKNKITEGVNSFSFCDNSTNEIITIHLNDGTKVNVFNSFGQLLYAIRNTKVKPADFNELFDLVPSDYFD